MIKEVILAILNWLTDIFREKFNSKTNITIVNSEEKREKVHKNVMNRLNRLKSVLIFMPLILTISSCSLVKNTLTSEDVVIIADEEKVVYVYRDTVSIPLTVDIISDDGVVQNKTIFLKAPKVIYQPTPNELKEIYGQ